MGQPPTKPKKPVDDPFFYRDGLDDAEIDPETRKRREAARAQARKRRNQDEAAIEASIRTTGQDMLDFTKRFEADPAFRAAIKKRTT